MQKYISSNLSIGILGGGQLGKMLTDVARKWDIRTHILDSNAGAPAKNSCYRFVQGDLMDYMNWRMLVFWFILNPKHLT